MPPKKITQLPAAKIQAMKSKKQAEKVAQAEKEAANRKKDAEKAARDKKVADKKKEMEQAKKARLAAGAAGSSTARPPAGPSKHREREAQLVGLIKEGELSEAGKDPDYEVALRCYKDAMLGFTEMQVKRPKLADKISAIQALIDEEATC